MSSRASSGQQRQHRSPTSMSSPPRGANNARPPAAGAAAAGAKQVVTPPKQPHRRKSRGGKHQQNPDMIVEKRVIDEILLTCTSMGSIAIDPSTNETRFIPVTDCLNWLQDLQRVLKRDHDIYRPISLKLGQWRIVAQKLIPLVLDAKYDKALILTVGKLLVVLTKPLSEGAKNAGRLVVDVKNKKIDDSVIQNQIEMRDNAIAQSDLL
mmetsp:Transcript_43055/g.77401  ORF Transcript_43055/g.77401 Transcript_43055/m.77401 type:complete len:209 (-) Transcript_43055:178-804(-)